MAQEDHQTDQMCNSSSGGKKPTKEKKAPQRGLGVAQLEKIRLEEQQKKAAAAAPAMLSSSSFASPPQLNPSFRPPPPPLPGHHIDVKRPMNSAHQLANMAHVNDGFEVPRHFNAPKVWNSSCEYSLDKGECISPMLDHGLPLHLNLPNESTNPIWSLTGLVQRTPQYQHPPSLMVNVPTSTSVSPLLGFQLEPPSNQSFYSNYTHVWPDKEKMVGRKRPYPFVDNPPVPSFNFKTPTFSAPTIGDGSASSGNGAFNLEHSNSKFRDECPPSCSASIPELHIKENNIALKENSLTISLPAIATRTSPGSKFNLPSSCLPFHNYEIRDFETIPVHQGNIEELIFQHGLTEQLPFYNFFPPPAEEKNCEAPEKEKSYCITNGADENIDLNLKL